MAQQFVNYVAEETVKLSRGESAATDREVTGEAERQATEAGQRLERAQQASIDNATREPNGALQPQIEAEVDLLEKVHQSLIEARGDIAEYQEKPDYARELPGLRAKAAELEKKSAELDKSIRQKSAQASQWAAKQQSWRRGELKMAQTASESSAARHFASYGRRRERLHDEGCG